MNYISKENYIKIKEKFTIYKKKISESKNIISECIEKYGEINSYLITLNKINELEMLLDDSYKTTINGLNKSNIEAKNNFIIL